MILSDIFEPDIVPSEIQRFCNQLGEALVLISGPVQDSEMSVSREDVLEAIRRVFESRNAALNCLMGLSIPLNTKLSFVARFEVSTLPIMRVAKDVWYITDEEIMAVDVIAEAKSSAKPPTPPPPTV